MEKKARIQNEWLIMVLITLAYTAVVANIQGFKALFPLLMEEFMVSRAQIGLYTSFYFFTATVVAISSGRIVDRIGAKKGLIWALGGVGVMMLLHTISPYFFLILLLSFFVGFGFSLIAPSVNKGIFEFAAPSRRGPYMGIVHGGSAFGGFMGATFLPFFGEMAGWRKPLLFVSLFSVLISLLIYWFYHIKPLSTGKGTALKEPVPSFKENLFAYLRNYYLLSFCLMGTVLGISVSSISGHFTLYLTQDLQYSPSIAGLGLGVYYIGGVVGQPTWGLLIDKYFSRSKRKGLFIPCLMIVFLTCFFGLVISRFPFPYYAVMAATFSLGFCTMGMIASQLTAVSELVSPDQIGAVTGIALVFSRIGMVLAPPLFGLIADINGAYAPSWVLLSITALFLSLVFFFLSGKFEPPVGEQC